MNQEIKWESDRLQWRKITNPYPVDKADIYKPYQLTNKVNDMILEVIIQQQGPYPAFEKKIKLTDLINIFEEIWEDQN